MRHALAKLKRVIQKIRDFLPSPLPVGLTEFNTWADEIIDTYQLPNNKTVRWALAVQIMHCGAQSYFMPRRYFANSTLKAMATQVAGYYMNEVKGEVDAARDAEVTEARKKGQDNHKASLSVVQPDEVTSQPSKGTSRESVQN